MATDDILLDPTFGAVVLDPATGAVVLSNGSDDSGAGCCKGCCICCRTITVTIFGGDFDPLAWGTYTLTMTDVGCGNLLASLLYAGTSGIVLVKISFGGGVYRIRASDLTETIDYGGASYDISDCATDDEATGCCPEDHEWTEGDGVTVECAD